MKVGKKKLIHILERETGTPKKEIEIYGKYEYFGNKERLEIGNYTIIAFGGVISIYEPVYGKFEDEKITHRSRIVEEMKETNA